MNNQIATINLVPGRCAPAVVRVSQYDVGRPLTFKVLDGTSNMTMPSGTTATIEGTKPSGLGFSVAGTLSGNTVTVDTTLDMTQESGMIAAEIRFTQGTTDIGTANFILAVEKTPHADGTTDGTQETMANLETRLQSQIDALDSRIDAIEGDQSIVDELDALDTRVTALEQGGSGISQTEKNLILQLFSKAAYAESDAGSAYDALEALWDTSDKTFTYNLTNCIIDNPISTIAYGARYTGMLAVQQGYSLNSVTVTMGGVDITSTAYSSGTITIPSVTGNIVITATAVLAAQSITAVYTQSGTVYDTDSLDSLKADLVVTANYSGGTSETVPSSNYTLSGTLAEGTSTITVTYAGLTDTFDVTVTSTRYTFYDYIYNSSLSSTFNEEYVDTGLTYAPSFNALNLEFEAMNSNSTSSTDAILGANTTDTTNTGTILWYARQNKAGYSAFLLGTSGKLENVAGDTRAVVRYTFADGGQSTIQSGTYSANIATIAKSAITNTNKSLILAGGYAIASGSAYGVRRNVKIGYIKFTDPTTDELVYHFIPAYDSVSDKYGFYETVNKIFYPSNGTYFRGGNWS